MTRNQQHTATRSFLTMAAIIGVAAILLFGMLAFSPKAYAALGAGAIDDSPGTAATEIDTQKKLPSVTITPKTDSPNEKLVKYSDTYTKQLKNFWVMSYYMQLFEKKGGGTITLKKGTYQLPISVQVPSNVTFIFEDGVVINKTRNTGTTRVKSNTPLFQMIAPSKYSKKGAVGNYNGTKNVKFIGKGNVVFNMNYVEPGCAIIMAQNQKMTFSGITFKNLAAHAFELDASKNVVIEDCSFLNMRSNNKTTEAINLDTPDKKTGGFSFAWSKFDKKPNVNVTIQNCTFKNFNRGIGTHKYSQNNGKDMMHTNIRILNNKFTNMKGTEGCVVAMNWKNVTIKGNVISGKGKNFSITEKKGSKKTKVYSCGIVLHSTQGAMVSNNKISNFYATISIRRGFTASGYKLPAKVSMTAKQLEALSTNTYVAGSVAYPEAGMTTETYYYWEAVKMWQPSTMAKHHFKTYDLTEA